MLKKSLYAVAVAAFLAAGSSVAKAEDVTYEITINNITAGQPFSPPVLIAHTSKFRLFTIGKPAGKGVWRIAEDGDNSSLAEEVMKSKRVGGYVVDDMPILPGQSRTYELTADAKFDRFSLCAMLGMTNDGFIAVSGADLETTTMIYANGWDAGTEENTESEATTAALGSPNVRDTDGAEGFVTIHRGIQGIGGIDRSLRDWRNPCAVITIRKK